MKSEEQFVKDARRILEQDLAALDPALGARLARARQGALDKAGFHAWFRRPGLWLAAAASVAAMVLAVSLSLHQPAPTVTTVSPEDLEILATADPLELYEDLEFLTWLEDVQRHAG